jgi:hypothetical protein
VLPDAAMTALGRGPLRARDALVDPLRQRDGDEDVFLPAITRADVVMSPRRLTVSCP